jgi:hypothetical protein
MVAETYATASPGGDSALRAARAIAMRGTQQRTCAAVEGLSLVL